MKKPLNPRLVFALLLAVAPLGASATVFFNDTFANGSTVNSATPVNPTTNSASYEVISSLATTTNISPNDLRYGFGNSGGNICEIQALFSTNAIALTEPGDFIQLTIVFTNLAGIYTNPASGALTAVGFGLYNSGSSPAITNFPVAGGMTTEGGGTPVSGGVQNWAGYMAFASDTTSSLHNQIYARPAQSLQVYDQDLVTQGSSTKSFSANGGPTIGSAGATLVPASNSPQVYTNILTITLVGASQLAITNNLYNSSGLVDSLGGTNSATAYTSSSFDGLAMGFYKKSDPANVPSNVVDVASITVSGSVTIISGPPTITVQPVPVTVPNGDSCAFIANASGFSTTYQWHRNGTNINNGGNISVVNSVDGSSSILAVSPAGPADVLSGANGYYVTVSGAGGYSTNSATNSLSLTTATNLIWQGNGIVWDLNDQGTINNWYDTNGNPQVFNFGDAVTFNDVGAGGTVTLTGPYLSAATVTVDSESGFIYTFAGTGSFAGAGSLIYTGPGKLALNNANTYTGGTVISNSSAYLTLGNLAGLGTGPVTLAKTGGKMEIAPTASSSTGIASDFTNADDFTIIVDATNNAFGAVFNGNFSGTTGKTLTIIHNPSLGIGTNSTRIRAVGTNTVDNANLVLGAPGDTNLLWATYQASGSQTYNGVISGPGGIMQKGTITYLNNGANTYSGGTFPVTGVIGLGSDSTGNPVTSGPLGIGPLFLTIDSSSATTGSGQVFASGAAHTVANSIQFPTGTNNLTLIIGGTNNLTLSGAFTLNGNDLLTTNIYTARTIQITNTGVTTFSGVISDLTNGVSAVYGLTITGNGTNHVGPLVLNNTETYTGPTTVTNGATLQVNGSLATASAVTVSTNATLAGTGTINGTVTISAGGVLAPGAASIGKLTVNNNVTIGGNLLFRVNKSLSPSQSNDAVVVSGTLSNAGTGTLTVTNFGPALVAGDRFVLFSKPLSNGNALTVTNSSVAFANNLAVDGSITVLSSASSPTSLKFTSTPIVSGTSLTISVTNTGAGTAYLLSSTNITASLNTWTPVWTNVLGGSSSFTTNLSNIVNPALKNQFYILSSTNN